MKKYYSLLAFAIIGMTAANAQAWIPQGTNFPQNAGVKEISIVDENTVWITSYDGSGAGLYPHDIAVTNDGGDFWDAVNISNLSGSSLISDIAGVSPFIGYIVTAPTGTNSNDNGIWKSSDGGQTWSKFSGSVFNSGDSFANHIYFWNEDEGYCGGDPVGGKFQMYKTTDGGDSWNEITTAPSPLGEEYTYVGVKRVVGDKIWLGTSSGRLLYSPDRGDSWDEYFTPALDFGGVITSGSSASFAFADDGMTGLLITLDNGTYMMYESTDGGDNWDSVSPAGTWYGDDVAAVPGSTATFVTSGIDFNIPTGSAYSEDGGDSWEEIDSGEQRGTLAFLNGTTGWCGQFSEGPGGLLGILTFMGDIGDLAVTDLQKADLQIYPNPATSVVNINTDQEVTRVNIIDMSGKTVMQASGKQIDVSSLAPGVYIAQVIFSDRGIQNTKLIVK